MEDAIVYRHKPRDGAFIIGVPQRDLTQADVDSSGPALIANAVATGLYEAVTVEPPTDTRTPAQKAADTRKANAEAAEAERLAAESQADAAAELAAAQAANDPLSDGDGDDESGDAGEGNDDE